MKTSGKGVFSMETNYSVQTAMLIAGGFTIDCAGMSLGLKDTEKLLKLCAESNLAIISDFYDGISEMQETE